MKKRMLAFVLAFMMLFSSSAYALAASASDSAGFNADGAAWVRGSEYFNGGTITYGTIELHSGGAYSTVHFAYGRDVNITESGMQTVSGLLAENRFPVISLPYDSQRSDYQSFLVLSPDSTYPVDGLINELERVKAEAAAKAQAEAETALPVVSAGDAQGTTLTPAQAVALLALLNSFGADKAEVSASDILSGSDAVSDTDVVSDADAVSGSDVTSGSDAAEARPGDITALLNLLGTFGSGNAVSGSDVTSASDAAPAPEEEEAEEPEEIEEPEEPVVPEVKNDPAQQRMSEENIDATLATLNAMRSGAGEFKVMPTLEGSLEAAFPAFDFGQPEPVAMIAASVNNVTLSDDSSSARIVVVRQPEYVDIELNGTVFNVLLMSQKNTSYTVDRVRFVASTEGVASGPVIITTATTTTTTAAPTTTTAATTTTTTTATTTTTTAATTAPTTTTAAPTTTTTTTTAAPTTTTTYASGRELPAYVSTQRLELRVRTGPGFDYEVITCIQKGTRLTVLDMSNAEWYKVRLQDGTVGYAYSYYITLSSQ